MVVTTSAPRAIPFSFLLIGERPGQLPASTIGEGDILAVISGKSDSLSLEDLFRHPIFG
jgi:hypothetical protein